MRRPSSMPLLLLCLVMIIAGGMNSVRDLLIPAAEKGGCEYCALAAEPPRWLPPPGLVLPSLLLDLAPATLAPLMLPRLLAPLPQQSPQEAPSPAV